VGGDFGKQIAGYTIPVSIHAPRVGGDGAWRNLLHALDISCHNCGLTAPLTYRMGGRYPTQEHLFECKSVSSSADVPVNSCLLGVRVRAAPALQAERSQDEWTFRVVGNFGAHVFDPPLPFGP
jgi:hypothetical protein